MKFACLALAALSLAGCASTKSVLNDPPTQIFHVRASANDTAFCLANKNSVSALDRDDGSKVILIKNGYGAVSMAFTVYPEGNGSKVEWRKKFGTFGGIWKQCVGLKTGS